MACKFCDANDRVCGEDGFPWHATFWKHVRWRVGLHADRIDGGAAALSLPGVLLPIGHVIAGSIWAIFHIMIITLQAFIFMMLTLVYVGQAHDAH